MNGVFSIQVALMLLGTGIAWFFKGDAAIGAALYGGGIALVNTLLLSRRMEKTGTMANPRTGLMLVYANAVGRFVFVLVALAIGLGFFKFIPLPLLGTFIITQLGYAFALGSRKMVEPS